MLFLTTLTLELCAYIPINPLIFISAEVCAANTGGGATLVGSPPNVIMGTTLGYGFNSFLVHMFPVAWISTGVIMVVYYLTHRNHLQGVKIHRRKELEAMDLSKKIVDKKLMIGGLVALGIAVILLITHTLIERFFRIPLTLGLAALVPALGLMVYENRHGRDVMRKIDLESLVFFIGLFVIVGGLNQVGAFQILSTMILTHVQNPIAVILIFLWFAALASAIVDNVPMALSMAYLIKEMKYGPGAPPEGIIVWASLIGLIMGGNMTPIGASTNVIAYGILERAKITVGWGTWAKLTVKPTILALIVASILICVQYKLGWY
jgi:Na+/H+ antiporter NhaD/arsenite permease-like protein